MTAKLERIVTEVGVPIDFTYNYRVGSYLEKYIQGLGEQKILAVKCSGCGKVVVPPRKICGECNLTMDEFMEVGPEGTVENFTIAHVRLNKGLVENLDSPEVIALVKPDGATGPIVAKLIGVEPSAVSRGMKVKAVFKDPAEGAPTDLTHFEAAG